MKSTKWILISMLALTLTSTLILAIAYKKHSAQIKSLTIQNNDLEAQLEKAKNDRDEIQNELDELESKFADVRHFDGGGSYRGSTTGVMYTGSAMETQIDGEFEGWDGDTIFRMMNGTIWQQASYDYTYHYAYMPAVLIYQKNGSYYMKVEDVDEEIMVTRIK